jgi:hypothetical protein
MVLQPSLPKSPVSVSYLRTLILPAAAFSALLFPVFDCYATTANQFFRLTVYSTGGTPVKIVTADFNRDGKPDVVALNSNNVLSIVLGSGNGAFGASKTIATLPMNTANSGVLMVAGDFNGDGNQDVAVAPSPGNLVKVFLGHGDGTFAAPMSIADGLTAAGDMVAGNFNGDDRSDIVVAGTSSVAVLLGASSGVFAKPVVVATGLGAPDHLVLAVGDVNRDSHLDIALNDNAGDFQILLGTGSGSFNLKPVFSAVVPPETMPTDIAIADFDGDGRPDIAASYAWDSSIFSAGTTCILPGYGDGTFNLNSPICNGAPYTLGQMLAANLNGKPDLVFSSDPLTVQLNNGKGVFTTSIYATGGGPMALGDFTGDGRQDIVEGTLGGVQVVANAGAGVLRAPVSIPDIAGNWTAATIMNSSDFNGDGYADLAVIDYFDEHGYIEPQMNMLLGGAKNALTESSSNGLGFFSFDNFTSVPPAIGDFNHDGHLDVAIVTTGDVMWNDPNQDTQPYAQVFFGDGKGNFPTAGPALDMNSNFYAAGDFNGDGKADLASIDGSTFEILIGKGDGTFASPVSYGVGANPVFVLQRDLNGDGKRDVIVVNQGSNDVSILLGKGDGTFLPQKSFAAGTAPVAAVAGDFNRDGKIDVAVASSAGISVLLGNGDGTFQAEKTYPAGGSVTEIVEASLRQDGIEDLIGIVPASQRFVVLPGTGTGTFGAPVVFPLDRAPTQMVAGDFNHDGAMDLAFLAISFGNDPFTGAGGVEVFYNQGGDHVTLTSSPSKPAANQSVTFTAHVTPSLGETGTPTGVVTFKDGSRFLGNISMMGGAASITTKLTAGTHKILAEYGGNSNFNPNHSATLTIVAGP